MCACVCVCETASVFSAMANLDLHCEFLTFLVNAFNGNQMYLRLPFPPLLCLPSHISTLIALTSFSCNYLTIDQQ